ncbi:hypothetical protein LCGC14_1340830 [marine sediment metagenome]|uniref:Glutaredoxin domain-containing protein n=1 Tax=marine sediment metagenome TaxID=412755 RepID=A0A0F9MUQ0_9ZZZZ
MKVEMYTLSTCPWCNKTKEFFKEKNIDFNYIDYDLADDEEKKRIIADMRQSAGQTSFPFVKIDDEVVVGYDIDKYEELIAKAS